MSLNARSCVEKCESTGVIGKSSIQHCQFPENDTSVENPWYMQEPLYLQWKQLNCRSDCRYHCMMQREEERQSLGLSPVKYHGKWPFERVFVFQVCHFVCLVEKGKNRIHVNASKTCVVIPMFKYIVFACISCVYCQVGVYLTVLKCTVFWKKASRWQNCFIFQQCPLKNNP